MEQAFNKARSLNINLCGSCKQERLGTIEKKKIILIEFYFLKA
jgi:hypothetical protein